RFESQLAKADKLGVEDRDKIELLQMALHIDFDARSRMTKIPSDDYAGAVAAYKDVAAPLRSSTHAGVVYHSRAVQGSRRRHSYDGGCKCWFCREGEGEGSGPVGVQGCMGRAAVIGPVLALRCRCTR
ncbi:hypothetical protein E4U34_006778, partial [Claviceps purpurea]